MVYFLLINHFCPHHVTERISLHLIAFLVFIFLIVLIIYYLLVVQQGMLHQGQSICSCNHGSLLHILQVYYIVCISFIFCIMYPFGSNTIVLTDSSAMFPSPGQLYTVVRGRRGEGGR
jgi:hypothetical protein